MTLPRYPAYKDSGIEWAAELPAHWGIASLKWLCQRYSGGTPDKNRPEFWENGTVPWLNSGAVNDGRISEPSAYITQEAFEKSSAKWIPSGALVMALAGQGKTKGMVAQLMFKSTCNQSMAAIVPQDRVNARCLYWWLVCNYQHIRNMAGGDMRDGLNLELLGAIPCPLPPPSEQVAIATFLDRETGKIDVLIAEQEKLILLLAEKRQVTICGAVTRGLNPDVPKKVSGIAMFGEIPVHWQVKKMRYVANLVRGASPRPAGDPRYFASDNESGLNCPWVTVAEVTKDDLMYLTEVDEYLTPEGVQQSQSFRSGTLIFTNSGATLGVPKILSVDCCANDGILVFKQLSSEVEICFLYLCLLTMTERLRTEMKQGGGQPNLNTGIVKDISFPLPPSAEQLEIVGYVEAHLRRLDALRAEAERAIELLRERRSALINAAVTGQIDARGAVPHPATQEKIAV